VHDLAIRHSKRRRQAELARYSAPSAISVRDPVAFAYPAPSSAGTRVRGRTGNWNDGFLPSNYQGVLLRSEGDAILHLSNPSGVTPEMQRADLDLIRELNRGHLARTGDQEIAMRVESHELAFRMQHPRRT